MLTPGQATAAAAIHLAHLPVPTDQIVSGGPTTASTVLQHLGDIEIGVWEMSPGAMRDTEADEVFVVVHGTATIEFEGDRVIRVSAGDVVRLTAGMRTTWTVTETLRKIYVS